MKRKTGSRVMVGEGTEIKGKKVYTQKTQTHIHIYKHSYTNTSNQIHKPHKLEVIYKQIQSRPCPFLSRPHTRTSLRPYAHATQTNKYKYSPWNSIARDRAHTLLASHIASTPKSTEEDKRAKRILFLGTFGGSKGP